MAYALGASSLKRAIEIVDLTDDSKFTKTKPRIQYEEGEKDIPRFTIETDDDEDEDNRVDFIRHLSETPFDLEDLQTRLAHRAASAPLPRDYEIINSATSNTGCNVRAGKTVELASEFLRVKQLIRDRNGEIHMRGILLYRVRKVLNMLPKKCNELCAIIKARADGKNPNIDDHLSTRPISDMISTRDVTFTNQLFPILSFREKDRGYNSWADVEEIAELVCRWKYIEHCDMVLRRVPIQSLLRLRQHECDVGKGVSDVPLMLAWLRGFPECASKKEKATIAPPVSMHVERANSKRGKKRNLTEVDQTNHDSHVEEVTATFNQTIKRRNRFGTYEKRKSSVVTERFTSLSGRPYTQLVNRHSTSTPEMSLPTRSVHTFGDICAGAGGATRAASQAGLAINIVLDHDPDACATQRKNFPSAKTLKMSIFEFLSPEFKLKSYMRVTVLHISFPCQIYSTAHTCDGKNDPANEAVGYAAINLLMKIRPRVATLEQTSNIVNGHTASFQALVHQLTYVGYSVRWKIVSFDETGNAHARMRLFMIASCPGQPTPPFPKATHGRDQSLQPLRTIHDILEQVPERFDSHMKQFTPKNKEPYDDNRPLKGCITTSGGEADLHPSGKRSFNLQELAQLAGFPAKHKFVGNKTSIRRQIGNAVPANAATPFFKEIDKCLNEFDKEVAAWKEQEQDIIEID